MAKFYATTAIPYVNGKPHIGHALEFVQADAIARYHRLIGDKTTLLSGSDENGLKIYRAAEKEGLKPQELCDRNTLRFQSFAKELHVDIDVWRRGTDQKLHWPGVYELWKRSLEAGDIYKKKYKGLYCVGCEDFYLPKDLIDGKCPEHLSEPEVVEEENYFFRLSKYQEKLHQLIISEEIKIVPEERRNETIALLESGLQDFSVSRSWKRAKGWGIPVPDDNSQVIYTWYDGLAIYMTGVGYNYDMELWKRTWPANIHFIGKGINRFHTIYWPAMLLSAKLPIPKAVFIHGYMTSGGQKMSKTLGNVVDPTEVVKRYGVEPTRYYLLREIPTTNDGDFTYERFEQLYQSDLANGLGNLIQRVSVLLEKNKIKIQKEESDFSVRIPKEYKNCIENFKLNEALLLIWEMIKSVDRSINEKRLWELKSEEFERNILPIAQKIRDIGILLFPFLPETSMKIQKIFKGPTIKAPTTPLFPRIKK